jgi:hypothetical protein
MPAGSSFRVGFDLDLNVMPGHYFLSAGWTYFEGDDLRVIHRRYDVITFDVLQVDRAFGIANCHARISFDRVA